MFIYPIYYHNWRNISTIYLYIYITRLASNEIFSPSNKVHRKAGRAKDLPAPRYSAARDASFQIDSNAVVKVMALLTLLAAGTSVFPRLAAADLCRAAACRPKVERTARANGSADLGSSCSRVAALLNTARGKRA
jgi:hypothetical protein